MKFSEKIDPFALFLRLVLKGFYKGDLKDHEKQFVDENLTKHRKVMWVNLFDSICMIFALREAQPEDFTVLITALVAPVVVLGGGWFMISFGAIPAKLISVSMTITLCMFTAFVIALTTMFMAVGFVTSPFAWPVLGLIYLGTVASCVMYDTADGLKAGLDEAMLWHSRAALAYYAKKGINPSDIKADPTDSQKEFRS